jgi:ubiquinol-cytochrome c reductase cytochrome c1 subunit
MKTIAKMVLVTLLASLVATTPALAAGDSAFIEHSNVNVNDTAALQRGASLFVNYCLSCHSANYMRYNRLAEDLDLGEELVMDNLVFSDAKIGETMTIAMEPEAAEKWFGKTPPDLSLVGRSRGADWLYSYFQTFYKDENGGWNNAVLPNASMPHVFWQLQGIQSPMYHQEDGGHAVLHSLEVTTPGLQTAEEYDGTVRDLVAFLIYLGEPALLKRKQVGVWVMLFLAFFAFLAYLLKAEFWRDVH